MPSDAVECKVCRWVGHISKPTLGVKIREVGDTCPNHLGDGLVALAEFNDKQVRVKDYQ